MSERNTAELTRIVDALTNDPNPTDPDNLTRLAEHVAQFFGVHADEVAILAMSGQGKFLKFICPEKLQSVGTIPVTSNTALAARTVREKRPEMINNFTATRHASVFEGVPMGRRPGELIHKIMSAPITADGKVLGVLQISRKGRTPTEAGADFTPKDVRDLVAASGLLAPFVKRCHVS